MGEDIKGLGGRTSGTQPPSVDANAPPEKAFSKFPPAECTACGSPAKYFCRPAPSDPTVIFGVCESHYWTAVIAGWKPQPIETPPVDAAKRAEWLPIESAPKDGRWLVAHSNGDVFVCERAPIGAIVPAFPTVRWDAKPTHWMPLPEPPTVDDGALAPLAPVDDGQRLNTLQKGQPNG